MRSYKSNIYDILFIFQYQVSTTVMDLVVVFAWFVFMLALLFFFDATVLSVNKDLYMWIHLSHTIILYLYVYELCTQVRFVNCF